MMEKKATKVGKSGTILGKRIAKIISKTRRQRDTGKDLKALLDMTEYVCEVRSYLRIPDKKIHPFSSISRASMYEKSDDVGAMAIAAAYRDIYKTDVYMIDGDRYGTEFFMPKTREGIDAWDSALMAISADPDIKDKTIYDLMISSYAKACFANMARLKEDMEKHSKPEEDNVIKLHDFETEEIKPEVKEPSKDGAIDAEFKEVPFEEKKNTSEAKSTGPNEFKEAAPKEKPEAAKETNKPAPQKENRDPKSLREKFKNAPKTKQEQVEAVDPAEMEHPTEDVPDTSGEVAPKQGPKEKTYTTQKSYSFSEAMKDLITFKSEDDEPDTGEEVVATVVSEPNPKKVKFPDMVADIPNNNAQFHGIYSKLSWFTDLMKKSGVLVHYQMKKFPFGDLISATTFVDDPKNYRHIGWVFIDPNVLYRDGYNVMTMNNASGNILKEVVCPMRESFEAMIVKMVKGTLNKKEQRNLMKMRPICTYKVFEMVDFTGLGYREPLETREWTMLVENLGDIIEKHSIKYRMRIVDYISPDNFKLVCDESVVPVGTTDDALILIKPITESNFMFSHSTENGETKFIRFVMNDNGKYVISQPDVVITSEAK